MSNVIMYTRNVCGGCDTVEAFLTQNGITPEKRNIEEKQEYMDELIDLGFQSVPVVVTKDNSVAPFAGFEFNELNQIVENYNQ